MKVRRPSGVYTLVAKPRDLRNIPRGISSQVCIGCPKMRNATPLCLRWAAKDNPYGPAPMIATWIKGSSFLIFQSEWNRYGRVVVPREGTTQNGVNSNLQ